MDTLQYTVVYNAGIFQDWWFPAGGAVMLAIFWRLGHSDAADSRQKAMGWFGVVFCAIWLFFATTSVLGSSFVTWRQMRDGKFQVVEGVVEDFKRGDLGGHHDETWSVRANDAVYSYAYSPSMLKPGYHGRTWRNSPLCEGAHVRVADIHGYIGRLEIASGSCP